MFEKLADNITAISSRQFRIKWLLLFPFRWMYGKRQPEKYPPYLQKVLYDSTLFDKDYYLQQYPEVITSGLDPASHYLLKGAFEGKNPSGKFDSQYYLSSYPDIAENNYNPLIHFIFHGYRENRHPHPKYRLKDNNAEKNETLWGSWTQSPVFLLKTINLHNLKRLITALQEESFSTILTNLKAYYLQRNALDISAFLPPQKQLYDSWIDNNSLNSVLIERLTSLQASWSYRPLISVVMPIYNVPEVWLSKAIRSLQDQVYDHWELCFADDASTQSYIQPFLEEIAQKDPRVKGIFLSENLRISGATNAALDLASGEFVLFMDHDDELSADALFFIVEVLNKDDKIDLIYSDEDKINEEGQRFDPIFKPDWSPELLTSYNYFNHLFCARKSLIDQAGGLRKNFDGAQDYDLILRLVSRTHRIHHIPKVLYHWRALENSIAGKGDSKDASFSFFETCRRSLQSYLDQQKLTARAYQPTFAKEGNLGLMHLAWPHKGPLVSIIIPSKNHYKTLKTCLESLEKTLYAPYEIILADNDSDDPKTLSYLEQQRKLGRIRVLRIPNPGDRFSYAYINNEAAKKANGELLLFLNDDTEVIAPEWLSQMAGYMSIKGVGITGAKLLYPDDTVQHAGVINDVYPHGYNHLPEHAFKNMPADHPGYAFLSKTAHNCSTVTGACLMIRKNIFTEMGGFDEENFALTYNDVDLCLRVLKKGERIVYAPGALLRHHESKSRKSTIHIDEVSRFKDKYRDFRDSYYNPNLSKTDLYQVWPAHTRFVGLAFQERPRLLLVSHNLNIEGAPLQMLEVALGVLQRNTFSMEVYSPMDGPLKAVYEEAGIPVHIFPDPISQLNTSHQKYESLQEDFRSWLTRQKTALVFANTLNSFYIHEICHEAGIPSCWNIHESAGIQSYFHYLSAPLRLKAIQSFQYPYATFFVSKSTKDLFKPVDIHQFMPVINIGIKPEKIDSYCATVSKAEARKELGIEADTILVLNVGTICERKGQKDIVSAAIQSITGGSKQASYMLVGALDKGESGAYLWETKSLIQQHDIEEKIHIKNLTPEIYPFYRAADVFVCSSYNESYPRVILEAMRFGLPIITTPVFGIKEQVLENVNALYFSPGNISKLAHHLDTLIGDSALRARLGKNSLYIFNMINTYEEMIDDYHALLVETWLQGNPYRHEPLPSSSNN